MNLIIILIYKIQRNACAASKDREHYNFKSNFSAVLLKITVYRQKLLINIVLIYINDVNNFDCVLNMYKL